MNDEVLNSIVGDEEAEAEASTVESDIDLEDKADAVRDEETETEVEAKTETEVKEEEKPKPAGTHVPAGLYAQQRKEMRALQAELQEAKDKLSQFDAVNEKLTDLQKRQAEMADPMPDPKEDPAGYIAWENRQTKAELKRIQEQQEAIENNLKTEKEQAAEKRKQEESKSQLLNYIATEQQAFEAKTPDYSEALAHIRQPLYENLIAQGYEQKEAIDKIYEYEFNTAVQLIAQGANPVQWFYDQAKQQGYTGKKPETDTPSTEKNESVQDFEQQIETVEKGKKSKSLGASGSKDIDDLADMDDEEFAVFKEAVKESFG